MNRTGSKKRLIFLLIAFILCAFVTEKIIKSSNLPASYIITKENRFDYQNKYECSGYAAAYVLRSFGIECSGLELYNEIPNKNNDGTVNIPTLVSFLQKKNYDVQIKQGSIDSLKNLISQDIPVITFVRVTPHLDYLHYLPVVGYDEEYIYTADSLHQYKNFTSPYYNRKISIKDFQEMWNTKILQKNLYIEIYPPKEN